ncbi:MULTISPECIES: hypothetical protein [Paenibacillus]|uniref:hypothetical protein n=1 Tax=Paenibacillus TaxID=44249 RepID=UPI0013C526B5|nr:MULTISPECIES: hypothetical protein [Paenibacillus]WFB57482.1 hypothetical protein P0X86_26490 [Paenibacillus sp. BR1-192]
MNRNIKQGEQYAVFIDYGPDAMQQIFENEAEANEEYNRLVVSEKDIPVYLCKVIKHS